jgi:hypothetical protein
MAYEPVPYPYDYPNIYENRPREPWEKRRYAFVWPRDGKGDDTFSGRLKDLLGNKGPDIFVRNAVGHRPLRCRWSNRAWLDPGLCDTTTAPMPWANRKDKSYNFYTRKYQDDTNPGGRKGRDPFVTWTGAGWTRGRHPFPANYRCEAGQYYQYIL